MNSASVTPSWFETLQRCFSRILNSYICWIPCLQRQHQVHPLNINAGRNKFLHLSAQRRIRIIHIDSRKLSNTDSLCRKPFGWNVLDQQNGETRSLSIVSNTCDSSEDDYWFTRWTQPLRISNNCNCSFKKHGKAARDSRPTSVPQHQDELSCDLNTQVFNLPTTNLEHHINSLPLDLSLIRAFAIDFIQDILDDAVTHVTLSRPNEMYQFISNNNYSEPNVAFRCEHHTENLKESNDMTNLCKCSCREDEQCINNALSQTHGGESVSGPNKGCSQSKDSVNASTGCINLSFLCSPTDPSTNIVMPQVKSCNHTKRVRKPLLYFLHGVGSSADIWWGLLRYFVSAGYEVLAPDMLGHGYSAAPDQASAYTFQHLLKDAVDIFDRFVGEHGKCVVIGHAYGCSLAAAVARYRTQVTHLVLISGGGPTPLAPSQQPPLFPCLRGCMEAFLVCGFKRDVLYAPCGKQMISCAAISCDMPEYVLRYMARGQDWPEGDSTFHRRILVPTLLVHGMRDPHVTLVQECEMERTIPRSFLELIPNAGHLAMLETPAQLSHMINCFIEWWSR